MQKPEITVVKFNESDIIATSGGFGTGAGRTGFLISIDKEDGYQYFTNAREAYQYWTANGQTARANSVVAGNFYLVTPGTNGNGTVSENPSNPSEYSYAWFDQSQWWTVYEGYKDGDFTDYDYND